MSDDDHAPASGTRRALRLAGMTARLSSRYAGHALANHFRTAEEKALARTRLDSEAGAHLAQTLGELKGAVMKLGQLASHVADVLPDEIAEALKALQKQAPPMPVAVISAQLEAALGPDYARAFARLDKQPFAAASIGQVHRGTLHDGREVIVKVQYPGVARSCDSDLKQLRRALQLARLIKVDKAVLDELFEEIRARLHEELDYRHEAANCALFREHFAGDPRYVIPATVPELCTAQVLTMHYEPGDSLEVARADYPLAQRNVLATGLFEFMLCSLFELQAVHADPNPANFAFRRDGSLVIYDFGCVKRLAEPTVQAYHRTVSAALDQDWRQVDEALHRLGVRIAGSRPVQPDFYAAWRPILLKPFLSDATFDFGASTIHQAVMAKSTEMFEHLDQFQPAADSLFLDRMSSGHYWTLVGLGSQVALGPLLREKLRAYPA